ncbi:thiamine phosphate synthase [Planococcus shenhongbingii]|uniref:Thiamine-phosphate synthase n=1 Tax=Planococcus shenhongbingii TaxID=3058398 RepID=A0ABT8NB77_9BACL|nr:thiamine phosphate synthase [Planococcus sp. N017]MDN7245106.1 thiamine phosphate synthase [Planococcus sp. N017]
MSKLFDKPSIYFIMGTQNTAGREPLMVLEQALAGGINHFQLREKGSDALTGDALMKFAIECKWLCRQYDVPFIVNDHIELAQAVDADGIHVGQQDAAATKVRRIIGADKILGVSVHSLTEAKNAIDSGADYVGMGPVFNTQTKEDAKSPAGVSGIAAVKKLHPELPVIGIGGITPDNAARVWSAGADGVAVISSIAQAENIASQVIRFKTNLKAGAGK